MNRWRRTSSGLNIKNDFFHLREPARTKIADEHNRICGTYEAKIAELEARLDPNALTICYMQGLLSGDILSRKAYDKLARITALASIPSWADIVEAGGRLELATQRLDAIRAILEEEG